MPAPRADPVTPVREAAGCSCTCATKTNYNLAKHLMKCHLLRQLVYLWAIFHPFADLEFCFRNARSLVCFLELMAAGNLEFSHWLSPQAPPLKPTAITVLSISTALASLWSLSMTGLAPTWWVTICFDFMEIYGPEGPKQYIFCDSSTS